MRERLVAFGGRLRRRGRRLAHRKRHAFRAWLEETSTVVHLSVLAFVPLLIGLVTYLSNTLAGLSYLLFPPLASGTYTLFANPTGRYASPVRFVAGLTLGALCGWAATLATAGVIDPSGRFAVPALSASLALFLVGTLTWVLDVEEPSAYSTALLSLLVPAGRQWTFVLSVVASTVIVSTAFYVWREEFYERRGTFLYESIRGDDHVLVLMRGEHADATAMLGARLAAAHEAGKVVLVDVVSDPAVARAERARVDRSVATSAGLSDAEAELAAAADTDDEADETVADAAATLEARADAIERQVDVPCEVAVAVETGGFAETVERVAHETNCDLVAAPHVEDDGHVAASIQRLFRADVDVLVHRSADGQTDWKNVLVPVRRASDVAHSMIDFGLRLAGDAGRVSVCTCIGPDGNRRRAETTLSNLVETFAGPIETRISRSDIVSFLGENGPSQDLVLIGASRDRSAASRIVSPPTYERITDLDADVAVVDRRYGRP